MELNEKINVRQLLTDVPECNEMLFSFQDKIHETTTLSSLAIDVNIPVATLLYGLQRTIKRATQNPCDYNKMKARLIKPNAVNIAGFVNFLWQNDFVTEMKSKAAELGIDLNINIFPKHEKKQFQNYLSLCKSPDDLPEVLIGKGFSSLITRQFAENFVKPGYYHYPTDNRKWGAVFKQSNLVDSSQCYHPFGVEEMVMVLDKSIPPEIAKPRLWSDLLKKEYADSIMQNGKNKRDHFGFNIMLYLYATGGEKAVERYALNVKSKEHFSYIIRNMGSNHTKGAPVNIVHQFASLFIRSEIRDQVEVVATEDGNPVTCHYYLLKRDAGLDAVKIIDHLYSPQIKAILEKCGTSHISSDQLFSGNDKLQWVGWDVIRELPLPYLKEYLSEIAYQNYKNVE